MRIYQGSWGLLSHKHLVSRGIRYAGDKALASLVEENNVFQNGVKFFPKNTVLKNIYCNSKGLNCLAISAFPSKS